MESYMDTKNLEQLGEILVKEHGLEDSVSTLERWMLHYLAELFDKEKSCANGDQKQETQHEIKDIILEFWQLRYQLAGEDSLFKKNQDLVNTLERISTQSITPYSSFFNPYSQKAQSSANTEWQDKLIAIDTATKLLMSNCVLKYLENIVVKNDEIVELIESIDSINSPESYLSKFFGDEKSQEEKIENIEERIENLTIFVDTAQSVLKEYRSELTSLTNDSK